jgi:B-cell receptor-associated protein 31
MLSGDSSPFFEVIFILLCVEGAITTLLVAPLPPSVRGYLVRWLSDSSALASLARPLAYFVAVLVLAWVFVSVELMQLQTEYDTEVKLAMDLGRKLQHESRMFRAQRNFYLTGFCALLLVVIARLYQLLKEANQLAAKEVALKKQAEGAAKAYSAMLEENKALEKKLKAGGGGGGGSGSDGDAESLAAEKEALAAKLARAEEERAKAVKDAEAMKKQAAGLSSEYARLMKDKEHLQNQLEDFELLAGDAAKKNR